MLESQSLIDFFRPRFDCLRALAIVLVFYCHFAGEYAPTKDSAWISASIGNTIFFIMSGLLLGLRYGVPGEFSAKRFLLNRAKRIFPACWLFVLCLVAALCLFTREDVRVWQVGLNMVGLGWFGMLPDGRHLWFITGILLFYLAIPVLRRVGEAIAKRWLLQILSLIVTIGLQFALSFFGVRQAYLLGLLWLAAAMFVFGRKVLTRFEVFSRSLGLGAFLLLLAYAVLIHVVHVVEPLFINYWFGGFVAIALSLFVLSLPVRHEGSAIEFLSKYSFEIYLVHYPLCVRPLALLFKAPPLLRLMIVAFVTIVAAMLLRKMAEILRNLLWKRN